MNEDESNQPIAARHYAFLTFLMLLNVMNFVDRQLLASFANFIKPELGLSDTEYGLLTGIVFIFFYAVVGVFMGALGDMFHRPRLVAMGLALWSLLTAASGAARGFVSLAVPRMFIGVGESVLTPTSLSMLSDRFPRTVLGFAVGVYYMGVPIGVGVSLLVAGYLGPAVGWRNCFYVLGAIGLALALIMVFVKDTPRTHHVSNTGTDEEPARPHLKEIFATLLRALHASPALGLTLAGGIATHFILGAAAFDQLWFVEERGFERADIAQTTGLIAVFAGVAGNLFGGIGSDWWQRNTGQGRPMFLFWVLLVLLPIGLAYRLVPADSPWFWIGVAAGFFQLGTLYGPTFSTVQELVPPRIRASIVAVYILGLNFIGLGAGSTLGGFLIDKLRAAEVTQPYTWMLLTFTLMSALAIPLFYLAGRRFQQDRDRLYVQESATL